eukprot:TRINITY_DN10609_c0_g2_i3.p1 TRINITY_DN10609_c0_g2~~TRINITY_DN10609_c0_g2_i3.p1  ORF type:complete len:112 (-),score=18.64 TRINITY_DN10609_c0_g2_i3:200-535(-)
MGVSAVYWGVAIGYLAWYITWIFANLVNNQKADDKELFNLEIRLFMFGFGGMVWGFVRDVDLLTIFVWVACFGIILHCINAFIRHWVVKLIANIAFYVGIGIMWLYKLSAY